MAPGAFAVADDGRGIQEEDNQIAAGAGAAAEPRRWSMGSIMLGLKLVESREQKEKKKTNECEYYFIWTAEAVEERKKKTEVMRLEALPGI